MFYLILFVVMVICFVLAISVLNKNENIRDLKNNVTKLTFDVKNLKVDCDMYQDRANKLSQDNLYLKKECDSLRRINQMYIERINTAWNNGYIQDPSDLLEFCKNFSEEE